MQLDTTWTCWSFCQVFFFSRLRLTQEKQTLFCCLFSPAGSATIRRRKTRRRKSNPRSNLTRWRNAASNRIRVARRLLLPTPPTPPAARYTFPVPLSCSRQPPSTANIDCQGSSICGGTSAKTPAPPGRRLRGSAFHIGELRIEAFSLWVTTWLTTTALLPGRSSSCSDALSSPAYFFSCLQAVGVETNAARRLLEPFIRMCAVSPVSHHSVTLRNTQEVKDAACFLKLLQLGFFLAPLWRNREERHPF